MHAHGQGSPQFCPSALHGGPMEGVISSVLWSRAPPKSYRRTGRSVSFWRLFLSMSPPRTTDTSFSWGSSI